MPDRMAKPIKNFRNAILVFLLGYILLSLFFHLLNRPYARLFFPLAELMLDTTYPDNFEFLRIKYDQNPGRIKLNIKWTRNVIKDGRPDIEVYNIQSTSEVDFICIFPIIAFSLILAWKGISPKVRLTAFFLSLPLLLAVTVLDISYSVMNLRFESISSIWQDLNGFLSRVFMNGGRQVTGFLIAWTAVGIAGWGLGGAPGKK